MAVKLDAMDRKLLAAIVEDARVPLAELARKVGLSPPSTGERLRKLVDHGVITGFAADISPAALGYAIEALARVRPLPGRMHSIEASIRDMKAITECDKVTGEDCFVVRLFARSIEELDNLTGLLGEEATINTSIVKRRLFARRAPALVE